MGVLCLITSIFFGNTETIELKMGREIPPLFQDARITFLKDDTFICCDGSKMYHFDLSGNLLKTIGNKGKGPGEFMKVGGGFFDGQYYIVYDSSELTYSFFDKDGKFFLREYVNGVKVQPILPGDEFFTRDFSFMDASNPKVDELKPCHNLLAFSPSEGITHKSKPFLKLDEMHINYLFSFNDTFGVDAGLYYIFIDGLKNEGVFLGKDPDLKFKKKVGLKLVGWTPPDDDFDMSKSNMAKINKHFLSFSYIRQVVGLEKGFGVVYGIPSRESDEVAKEMYARFNFEGQLQGEAKQIGILEFLWDYSLIGESGGYLYQLIEGGDVDLPYIKKERMQ